MCSAPNKPSCSAPNRFKRSSQATAQTSADARLNAEFENSGRPFDYAASTGTARRLSAGQCSVPTSSVSSYLERMQRVQLIQPFGCLLAVDESSFAVIAYSENAAEMLDIAPHAVPSMEQREALTIGMDARSIFVPQSAAALQKAAGFRELSLLNPILVHCGTSGKPFYAILHRVDAGLVLDLEPVNLEDVPVNAAGALKSYKLAAKAISRLQSLASGNIELLCDVLVRELRELTGYDRVMAYKFHEDEHGEVIAECRRPDLESYLGLHYPATDIPQASRFLFLKNKARIICDCSASPVKVIQDKKLSQPMKLCSSTLRAPHGCHSQYMLNMGSIATLVLSVTVNEDETDYLGNPMQKKGRKLWGLVVCHHTSPRFIPFPLRYACEFLLQVFGIQLNKEVELAAQARENHVLQVQSVLCDMLLRDTPVGIITQSPNVMDVVKCDGAALYYRDKLWLIGITPTKSQIRDITLWISEQHVGTTGLSTDSLVEAGYPHASDLGESVCGMAAIKITNNDFLFWFRCNAAKEIRWGGAKCDSMDTDDFEGKMHPRSSFKAFLEVAKQRSLPWEDVEMDAIHSLQLILRGSLQDVTPNDECRNVLDMDGNDQSNSQCIDELQTVTTEMVRLIETASVPIFAIDISGNVNGWNMKVAELTGLSVQQAIGMPLLDLVDDSSVEVMKNTFVFASEGKEEKNIEFKLKRFGNQRCNGPLMLVANACCSRDSKSTVLGVSFVAQDVTRQKRLIGRYARIQGDYITIIKNPNSLIPPLFMIDESGFCVEWNMAMQNLTGLRREDAINRILIGEVFGYKDCRCQVKDMDMLIKLKIVISNTIAGHETEKLLFNFFNTEKNNVETLLSSSRKVTSAGRITGVVCFLHAVGLELNHLFRLQTKMDESSINSLRQLAYVRQEIEKPLCGIKSMTELLKYSSLNLEQRQILQRRILCQEQLSNIMKSVDLLKVEESSFQMNSSDFNLGEILETIKFQVMNVSKERQIPLVYDVSEDASSMYLYGDHLRLQRILSSFLHAALQFTRPASGSVMLQVTARQERFGVSQIVHLDFRIAHPAPGVPDVLIQEMFHHKQDSSSEGIVLQASQKLAKMMDGVVQYLRDAESSSFIILVKFPLSRQTR